MKVLVVFFALAISLGARSTEGDVSFTLDYKTTGKTYELFIKQLREALTVKSKKVYNIPVLPASLSTSTRFLLVHLTNYQGVTVTVAIDVENVYIVASSNGRNSSFFTDAPKEASKQLFKNTMQRTLSYSSNYNGLESAAGTLRENINLGLQDFSSAIGNLFYYKGQPPAKAFIVIIQTISEAARYNYIENKVSEHVDTSFKPDPKFRSLENRWSDLSEQIQIAQTNKGNFKRSIELQDVHNKAFYVSDVNSEVVKNDIALLKYYKPKVAMSKESYAVMPPKGIRMSMIPSSCGHTHQKSHGHNSIVNPGGDIAAV